MTQMEVAIYEPIAHFTRHASRMRAEIEDVIERLFVVLDKIDGDTDAEDDGTAEPSLGWTLTMATGNGEDMEEDRCYF